jgi:hypothetical protein
MQPDTIASAYLRSLVHFPTGHFCTLTQRPLPRLLTLDFELWMDGFEAALDATGFAGPLPTRDEIRWYVDVALARYFEASVDAPAAEMGPRPPVMHPADFAREHRRPPSTHASAVDARDAKKKPRSVTLRRLKVGLAMSG